MISGLSNIQNIRIHPILSSKFFSFALQALEINVAVLQIGIGIWRGKGAMMKCGGRNKHVVVDPRMCQTDPPSGMKDLLIQLLGVLLEDVSPP